jgi:hypothetical protein
MALLETDKGMLVPTGINGAGDVMSSIMSCGQCISPLMPNVSIDMLEQELFQEELQTVVLSPNSVGLMASPLNRVRWPHASHQAELMYHHIPASTTVCQWQEG